MQCDPWPAINRTFPAWEGEVFFPFCVCIAHSAGGSFSPLRDVLKLRPCIAALSIEYPKATLGQDTGTARRRAEGSVWWYRALQEL